MTQPKKIIGAAVGLAVGIAVAIIQPFPGLTFQANAALAILIGAVFWWVVGIFPEYVTAFIMAILFIVVSEVPTEVVFSSFATSTWWLLVAAFGLGLGMQRCGLMRRMALGVLRIFPNTFKAQAAGLMAAGTVIGPFIPSLSAKAIMLAPLSMSISDTLGYPRKGRQAQGLFLAMFTGLRNIGPAIISASIIGYGVLALLPEETQQQFDMVHWFLAALPWFIIVTALNYAAIVAIYAPRKAKGVGSDAMTSDHHGGESSSSATSSGDHPSQSTLDDAAMQAGEDSTLEPSESPSQPIEQPMRPGPWSLAEKQMMTIMAVTVILWVLEPYHGLPAFVVALGALALTLICGIFTTKDFRSGIAWDSLVFIGIVFGLAEVFEYLGIDVWIVNLCQPVFESMASNPYAFVVGIGVMTVLLRFVIVSEMAYINLFMAFMVPLTLALGISPWLVGFSVYALVNPWFVMYQNPVYLTAFYAVDGQMVRHSDMAKYCVLYVLICLSGLLASVPYWQSMGLL